jgi:ABC-type transport system involved in cytochrome c biogenesis permease subunit
VGYFHARNLRGWRDMRAPLMLVVGFGALMFSYFGVNLW